MRQVRAPPGPGFSAPGRTLIALPIVLAAFALILQLSNRSLEERTTLYFHQGDLGALR